MPIKHKVDDDGAKSLNMKQDIQKSVIYYQHSLQYSQVPSKEAKIVKISKMQKLEFNEQIKDPHMSREKIATALDHECKPLKSYNCKNVERISSPEK